VATELEPQAAVPRGLNQVIWILVIGGGIAAARSVWLSDIASGQVAVAIGLADGILLGYALLT
jgi:hypothetical protein